MKNILVIDDDAFVLHAIARYLRQCLNDSRIFTASNGLEGLEVMKDRAVDLVLTDLNMPFMNGFTFIEQARKEFPSLPIFVMTASSLIGLEEDLRARGVARCFEKPFSYDEMKYAIARELKCVDQIPERRRIRRAV